MKTIEKQLAAGGRIRLDMLTDRILRIRVGGEKTFKDTGLNRYGFIAEPEGAAPEFEPTEEKDGFVAVGARVSVCCKDTGELRISDNSTGETLLHQVETAFEPNRACVRFKARDEEDWVGFGDQTRERLYHRGHSADLVVLNVKSYVPVPFFMSTHGVGVMVNTTHRIVFDMCKSSPDCYTWSDHGGRLDYYVMFGNNFREILEQYQLLTGKPKLPPEWSFGLWYICRTQANDYEAVNDACNFRREEIPCDVIGLEPGWMETNYDKSTEKKWNEERFPIPFYAQTGPNNFFNVIKRMGFHFELWLCNEYDLSYEEERRLESNVPPDTEKGADAEGSFHEDAEVDTHLLDVRLGDPTVKPDEPWYEHLKKFVDQGADFFKHDGAYQICPHPDRLWGNGMTDAEMHNLYNLLYSRQMYQGFLEHTGRRPLVFTVAGWTGFHAWCGTWTGDTGGGFETLGAMLNTSLVGHSWCTNDMVVTEPEAIHFGYLQPWSQINSWNYFRMPWVQGDRLLRMHKDYSSLRARLIPYIYSWAHKSSVTGYPLLVPLTLEYQDDVNCRDLLNQYLLGRDLMVCIYRREVYFPQGRWKDYWTGKVFEGGRKAEIDWPETRGGGLFVREGGIVPHGPLMQYRKQKPVDKVNIYIFPGRDESRMDFYEDDGVSMKHLEGEFATTAITARCDGDSVVVDVGETEGTYDGKPENRSWAFTVGVDFVPAAVSTDDAELGPDMWHYDETTKLVTIRPQQGPVSVVIRK